MISATGPGTFVWWLSAAALPPLIYWLYRRRRTVMNWSANLILRQTIRQEGRKKLWQAVVIMALRSLAIASAVLSLAGLVWVRPPPAGALPHGEGTLHQIVLLDNTRSMILRHGTGSREDEMRSRLAMLLKRLRHGDHCDIVLLASAPGSRPAMLSPPCPIPDDWIGRHCAELELQELPAAVADALQTAAERFNAVSARNRHLIWLGDLSGKDLPRLDEFRPLKRELQAMGVKTVAYEIRDRAAEKPNIAIAGGELSSGAPLPGWVCHLYLSLRNYGRQSASSSLVFQVLHAGKILENRRMPIEIKPGEQQTLDLAFSPPPDVEGRLELKAEAVDESYPFDNSRQWILPVKPKLNVLLVVPADEDSVPRTLWRDSRYVELALLAAERPSADRPGSGVSGGSAVLARDPETGRIGYSQAQAGAGAPAAKLHPAFQVRRATDTDISPAMIGEADVVVADGVCRLDPSAQEALENFVRRGGGALLGMGDSVIPEDFNETFRSLVPLPLADTYAPIQRSRPDWEYDAAHQRIEKTFESPFLRRCLDESQSDIEHARIYNYMRLAGTTNGLISLGNGEPLLVEKRFGRGAVLLWTSTLGGMWNTLPVRNVYVNLLQGMISHLAGFGQFNRNLAPGEPLIFKGPTNASHAVVAPDGAVINPEPPSGPGEPLFRFDGTAQRGEYRVMRNGQEVDRAVVWEALPESDVRGLSEEETSALEEALGLKVAQTWNEVGPALGKEPMAGLRLDGYLALAVLGALAADAVLTRLWFG